MKGLLALGALLVVLLASRGATAHALAPVVVRLADAGPRSVALSVRFPSPEQAARGFSIQGCDAREASAVAQRDLVWAGQVPCAQALSMRELVLPGGAPTGLLLEDSRGSVLNVRLYPEIARGAGVELRSLIPAEAAPVAVYLAHGVRHVWSGADHLAFLACLVLMCGPIQLAAALRRLVGVVSLFTVAHSLSLGVSVLLKHPLNTAGVEAAIALSVVFAAREASRLRANPNRASAPQARDRGALRLQLSTLAFGLLHGLGFAGGLLELGLPASHVPLALLLFNLGVELGQLSFVCCLAAALGFLPRRGAAWARLGLGYSAGSFGVYWLVERIGLLSV